MNNPNSRWTQALRLLGLLKYALAFVFIFLYLPLTAFEGMPLHSMTGGIFHDLTGPDLFFITMGGLTVIWSFMFTVGLLVQDAELDDIPVRARALLNYRIVPRQFAWYNLLGVPPLGVAIWFSSEPWVGFAGVVLGAVSTFLLMTAACGLTRLAFPGFWPLVFRSPERPRSDESKEIVEAQARFRERLKFVDGWQQWLFYDSLAFVRRDVRDLPALATNLRERRRPFDKWLYGELSSETKTALENEEGAGPHRAAGHANLVRDLNRIVRGPSIFSADRFSGVELRPETRALLAQEPDGDALVRLNRFLVEDASPFAFRRRVHSMGRTRFYDLLDWLVWWIWLRLESVVLLQVLMVRLKDFSRRYLHGSFEKLVCKTDVSPAAERGASGDSGDSVHETGPNGDDGIAPHIFALTSLLALAGVYFVVSVWFAPGRHRLEPGAAAYVFAALGLAVWVFGGLQYHLRRRSLSPLWTLLPLMAVAYTVLAPHHTFDATTQLRGANNPQRLAAVDAARRPGESNLVVVAASGGGILAAAWTTWTLHQLCEHRPDLLRETRLISGVSGGSVGAAFLVDAALRAPPGAACTTITTQAFERSCKQSLGAVTYGLAMLDFPRLLTGGLLPMPPWRHEDRGRALEWAWARHAAGEESPDLARNAWTLASLNPEVRVGRVPALIMGSTVVETGRRVMLTGLEFDPAPDVLRGARQIGHSSNLKLARAPTLGEFYFQNEARDVDLGLWVAARLSASFPYVTPNARARLTPGNLPATGASAESQCHLADGGYYDNFGVGAALDWLEPVLDARLREGTNGGLTFGRVLLIQLRAFQPSGDAPVALGSAATELMGPLQTLMNGYSASAITRNDIAWHRFRREWNERFEKAGQSVRLETVVFDRPETFGPLSWHLTRRQIEEIKTNDWPARLTAPVVNGGRTSRLNDRAWSALEFLGGTK